MNLQARRISGSAFTAEDVLEVVFNPGNTIMEAVTLSIELVSGENVTHGGGAIAEEYLHYKAFERDADADGIIDYTETFMVLVQDTPGTSVVRVICKAVTKDNAIAVRSVYEHYQASALAAGVTEDKPNGIDGTFTEEPPTITVDEIVLKTGEITLEWSEDSFV